MDLSTHTVPVPSANNMAAVSRRKVISLENVC